jgi:hypothetical protein
MDGGTVKVGILVARTSEFCLKTLSCLKGAMGAGKIDEETVPGVFKDFAAFLLTSLLDNGQMLSQNLEIGFF